MKNPRNIEALVPGYAYTIPVYMVSNDGITDICEIGVHFCRGDKNDETKPRQEGIFVESLIEVIVDRLKTVNVGDLASRETSTAITKLEEAMMWLGKRSEDRKARGVEQTYKK